MQPAEIFNLADSKPHLVQIKSGFVKFTSKAIVIISNKIPEHWWKRQTVSKKKLQVSATLYYLRQSDVIN
ncbi:unnamed protein product [Wuchereria bancrofti]|uniref:Uncharacterized protein n=1 Tax=Wuchereria bancrofti TaxID=6293 RepID=A0A3P7FE00_WUCBA|nr:unnamed protein product [Wuchereria bancrofti]